MLHLWREQRRRLERVGGYAGTEFGNWMEDKRNYLIG